VDGRLLTLGTPMLRSTVGRLNPNWTISERLPDVRLKLARFDAESFAISDIENQIRGVEIRLPMSLVWLGYETPVDGEDPRATFSIRRGF
jgi:hypothetical protein